MPALYGERGRIILNAKIKISRSHKIIDSVIKSKNIFILNFFPSKQIFLLAYLLFILANIIILVKIIIFVKKIFYNC